MNEYMIDAIKMVVIYFGTLIAIVIGVNTIVKERSVGKTAIDAVKAEHAKVKAEVEEIKREHQGIKKDLESVENKYEKLIDQIMKNFSFK